jgi:hypothetical protein
VASAADCSPASSTWSSAQLDESALITVMVFVVMGVLFAYPILFEALWRGQTPGKRAAGLRVVRLDGGPIGWRESFLRSLGAMADFLLPPGGLTGLLFVWGTERNQRIGDLIAGTIVVRTPTQLEHSAAFWFEPPWGHEAYVQTIDPTAMTVEQYTLVRSFLLRVHQFSPAARNVTATRLADGLCRRIGHVRPPQIHAEAFLLCAISRYQRQHLPAQLRNQVPGAVPGGAA